MSNPFSGDLSPAYNVDIIDMSNPAGQTPQGYAYNLEHGFIQVTFRDAFGTPVNNVNCQVSFGQSQNDRIPLDYNGRVFLGERASRVAKFYFDSRPGVFIFLVTSPNPNMLNLDTPNPLQSFTTSIGASLTASAITVNTTATLISASSSTTQSRILQNNGANTVFLGASGVTVAQGFPILSGASLTLDKSYGEIWGITASGISDIRLLREVV